MQGCLCPREVMDTNPLTLSSYNGHLVSLGQGRRRFLKAGVRNCLETVFFIMTHRRKVITRKFWELCVLLTPSSSLDANVSG